MSSAERAASSAGSGTAAGVRSLHVGARLPVLGVQQPLVGGERVGRRRGSELVAQQRAQALEDAQPLGDVALAVERLHQQHVARLAVGLGLDQAARRPLDRGQLSAAHHQAGAADDLQRLEPEVVELAPPRLQPVDLDAGQQPAAGDVDRHLGQPPRLARRHGSPGRRCARCTCAAAASTSIQTGSGSSRLSSSRPDEHRGAERRAQPREQGAQRGVLGSGRRPRPQRPDQLLAADRPASVERQIGEQQRDLATPQAPRPLATLQLDREATAELDPGSLTRIRGIRIRQRFGNVSPTRAEQPACRGTGAT